MHRDAVTRSWGPLLCRTSNYITSCCSMIMHGPMLQGSVHNSWKLKTSQFLHGQHKICSPSHQLRLIALNTPQSGNMKGIRGPDYLCFEQARAAGLRGTFRAFLSSKVQDLHTIVRHSDREKPPIVNLKVRLLFDSWQSVFGESASKMRKNVPIYSFDGRDILRDSAWPEKMVWHGSSKKGHRQTDQYCEAWRAGDQAVTGLASSLQSSHLLQQTPTSCSRACIVLCIENAMVSPSK
uniref:Collagenase NC10/endostatin domain-containing protein n=1 Tax=Oryzias latipes TaxID=8090 RepID=A0A3P9HIA7_ORYLA